MVSAKAFLEQIQEKSLNHTNQLNTETMKSKARIIASLKIWVVIYPSITLFLYMFGEALSVFPLYVRTLVLTVVLVPWIVFAGVPFVDSIIKTLSPAIKKDKYDK